MHDLSKGGEANKTKPQGVPYEILPDHEEAQPIHPHHAARGSGHLAQGVRQVRVWTGEEPVIRRYEPPSSVPFPVTGPQTGHGDKARWRSECVTDDRAAGLSDKQIEDAVTTLVRNES